MPVIVNGDICSIEDADAALDQSGADGVMIGRGAYGRPWLLGQVMDWLADRASASPTRRSTNNMHVIAEHYDAMLEHYGNEIGVNMARKHIGWYTKGLPRLGRVPQHGQPGPRSRAGQGDARRILRSLARARGGLMRASRGGAPGFARAVRRAAGRGAGGRSRRPHRARQCRLPSSC